MEAILGKFLILVEAFMDKWSQFPATAETPPVSDFLSFRRILSLLCFTM